NLSSGFDSIQTREADVQQNQIRLQFHAPLNRFQSVRDFADDLQIAHVCQRRQNELPKRYEILHDKNADWGYATQSAPTTWFWPSRPNDMRAPVFTSVESTVSAKRTPSCKDSRRNAMLRHDQALKEGVDEVAKAGFRART